MEWFRRVKESPNYLRLKDTGSLFSSWSNPCFDDCVNKKALIGYNDETDRVVVIKVYT